jgi:hypothetical protein
MRKVDDPDSGSRGVAGVSLQVVQRRKRCVSSAEILNLFSSPEAITDHGAKTVLEILASDGLPVMLARAHHFAQSVNDKRTALTHQNCNFR